MKFYHQYKDLGTYLMTEQGAITEFYNYLISIGFTCKQTTESQFKEGVRPTFEFVWVNGQSFIFGKNDLYETATAGIWYVMVPNVVGSKQQCRIRRLGGYMWDVIDNSWGENQGGFGWDILYNSQNFIIVFSDMYHVMSKGSELGKYPGSCTVGNVLSSDEHYLTFTGPWFTDFNDSNPNNLNRTELRFDTVTYYDRYLVPLKKSLRLPSPSEGYLNITDYIISTYGSTALNSTQQISNISSYSIPVFRNTSYVPQLSKIRIGDSVYYALDSYTLVKLDN